MTSALVRLTICLCITAPAWATSSKPPTAKKDQARDTKKKMTDEERAKWHATLKAREEVTPLINAYNVWTKEWLAVALEDGASVSSDKVNHFLRCRFTNREAQMDERLFPTALKAARRFKVDRIHVISGFRSPKYNLMLRKKGRNVARRSQHTLGRALDFRLVGFSSASLRNWSRGLRLGGVGYYRYSDFVHVDVDRVRYWSGS